MGEGDKESPRAPVKSPQTEAFSSWATHLRPSGPQALKGSKGYQEGPFWPGSSQTSGALGLRKFESPGLTQASGFQSAVESLATPGHHPRDKTAWGKPGPPGDSPRLRPHAEQVAATGWAGSPHRPVVLAISTGSCSTTQAPAPARGPPRPHGTAAPASSPGSCPTLTRAPIYNPELLSPAAVPPPSSAATQPNQGGLQRNAANADPETERKGP